MPDSVSASVISTGGGGTSFEHQVGGAFLTLLLTGTYVPIFPDAVASKVHFQAKRLGWNVDDLVVEATTAGTTSHMIAAQVKRTFTISANDDECRKSLVAAWRDFQNESLFDPAVDALVLITHLGTNRILGDLGWLLTQARVSTSAHDFNERRNGTGLLNKRSKRDYETIKSILEDEAGTQISDETFWSFLKIFYVLSFDLTSPTAKDESWVRMLLSIATQKSDPAAVAAATWAELVKLAAESSSHGASFARSDLPPAITARHRTVGSTEHHSIASIRQHSEIVLGRVADVAPNGLSFRRESVAAQLASATIDKRIVVIVGAAGSGKSVLAKRLVRQLASTELVVVFAAEEFHAPHIDTVLTNAHIGVNWTTLLSLYCMHSSKTILLEGLERLLETNFRGALNDLLQTVKDDPSIRLVITCREYHAETVERAILQPSGISFARIVVPDLTDEELEEARQTYPWLDLPLSSPALRRLLRNPFALARAAESSWPPAASLPSTEKALRDRLWGDIVRKDSYPGEGMPGRRATAMTDIALSRARSLRPYVETPSGDPQATHALATDSLLAFDSAARLRAAPAHDVLEDWALIEWLSAQFLRFDGDAVGFAKSRDAHPALRRAYRKWLHEIIETDGATATAYLAAVTTSDDVPSYLRDDTLIAIFHSSTATSFLNSFSSELLKNKGALLQRAIHLIRVACKTASPLAEAAPTIANHWHVPAGPAWANLLEFIERNWAHVGSPLRPLLISFLEDWATGVSWANPYPPGFKAAGQVIQRLLPIAQEGSSDSSEKHRVIALLTKVPKAAEDSFKDLVDRRKRMTQRREDIEAEILGELLQKPFGAYATARDFPQELIELCREMWKSRCTERDDDFYSDFREIDSVFGIDANLHRSFFPASALQGPFKALLQTHPQMAIRFIVSLMNDAADHYGNGRSRMQYVSEPEKVQLHFPDGTVKPIWTNDRLWNAYRATSVVSDLLESALMALEAWLLDVISFDDAEIESSVQRWLDWILRNSNNVASIATVASVCIAHPAKTLEASIIILGCREFFALDRQRMVQEHGSWAPGGLGYLQREFQKERLASSKLSHRRRDLEQLARDLQFVDRDRVWATLDAHRSALPPQDEQDDSDRLWRLALNRMDLREYETAGVTEDGYMRIQMRRPAADVQAVIDRGAPEQDKYNRGLTLFLWATNQYERRSDAVSASAEWRERLKQAQAELPELLSGPTQMVLPEGGPGITAAVCIRDYWDELTDEDRNWCVETVMHYLARRPSGRDAHEFIMKDPMNGVPTCANVMPLVRMKRGADPAITSALIMALVHHNEDARFEAAKGVGEFVVGSDSKLAAFCTWIPVANACVWNKIEERNKQKPYNQRRSFTANLLESAREVERLASQAWYDTYPDLRKIGFGTWAERHMVRMLIHEFQGHVDLPEAQAFFRRLVDALKTWWNLDRRRRSDTERRDYELEHAAESAIAAFLLDCPSERAIALAQPLFSAIETAPHKVAGLFRSLLSYEDGRLSASSFWDLWSEAADKVRTATWLADIDREHSDGRTLIRECFLNTHWKEGIETWSRLGDNFDKIDALFEQLPASPVILEGYLHYLYHIGRDSLPRALVLVANKFPSGLGEVISADTNTRYYLDELISREMFVDSAALRTDGVIRAAVMVVLDGLIQAGSSVAFHLRDDFVTPFAS